MSRAFPHFLKELECTFQISLLADSPPFSESFLLQPGHHLLMQSKLRSLWSRNLLFGNSGSAFLFSEHQLQHAVHASNIIDEGLVRSHHLCSINPARIHPCKRQRKGRLIQAYISNVRCYFEGLLKDARGFHCTPAVVSIEVGSLVLLSFFRSKLRTKLDCASCTRVCPSDASEKLCLVFFAPQVVQIAHAS